MRKAFIANDGSYTWTGLSDAITKESAAFKTSLKVSIVTALMGVVLGTLLAYAAATATRPKWLRSLVSAFSGVAANMGGIVLAFAFFTLLGRQGLGTKLLTNAGYNLYNTSWFDLTGFWGWATVYMYFQVPLMVLVTLPAIDGLQASWREASSNLGGTTWTYWRRVGLPILAPSMLGGFLLLFANSFSAYATAAALTQKSLIVPLRIGFYLRGDVSANEDQLGFSLAAWMILIMTVCMGLYWVLRKRAERWQQ